MSHIVAIQTKVRDPVAIVAACRRLGLPEPTCGRAGLDSGEATGWIVQLTGWRNPVVIDTQTGVLHCNNFQARRGDQAQLQRFLRAYAVERCRLEAQKKGLRLSEETLPGGTIKLQISEEN